MPKHARNKLEIVKIERKPEVDFGDLKKTIFPSENYSILRKEFDEHNWTFDNENVCLGEMKIDYHENQKKQTFKGKILTVSKTIRPYEGVRRSAHRSINFFETISINEEDYNEVESLFKKGPLVNPRKVSTDGDSSYVGPFSEYKRNIIHKHIAFREEADELLQKLETKNNFISRVNFNHIITGQNHRFDEALEFKTTSHYIQKPLTNKEITKDRQIQNIVTVLNAEYARPGSILLVFYSSKKKEYAFQHYGLFNMFGNISIGKGALENFLENANISEFKPIRIYDGFDVTISAYQKDNWKKEFYGKDPFKVIKTLDERFNATADIGYAQIITALPNTTDFMYITNICQPIKSKDFIKVINPIL